MGFQCIKDAYEDRSRRMRMRAVAHIEPAEKGGTMHLITELPFQVPEGGEGRGVIRKIADLVTTMC